MSEILFDFFAGRFKLELATVITSKVGSGNQRWHQGFQYLFHPEERLPPFATVVGIPLVDVDVKTGPTEICPGKNLRFYQVKTLLFLVSLTNVCLQGYRCPKGSLKIPSKIGDVTIFDYKTLHRGPPNLGRFDRPMISLVFSKLFFMNQEALTNRGIPLLSTLHQRRYWEMYFVHPKTTKAQWQV